VERYGLLAGLAGDSGAEWSLFWPGSGILLVSCSRDMPLLVRPAGASTLVAVAGVTTVSAAGTDASAELAGGALGAGVLGDAVVESDVGVDVRAVIGDDGVGWVLLHAQSVRVTAKKARTFMDRSNQLRLVHGPAMDDWGGASRHRATP
jgi:hypothetical protein